MNGLLHLFFILQWLSSRTVAQQIGAHLLQETPPSLKIQHCTSEGVCHDKSLSVTLDADMRPLQYNHGISSCVTDDQAWNRTICAESEHCAESCGLGGVKYTKVHGVSTHDHSLKLRLFTNGKLTQSRVYLLEKDSYKIFYLKNREFSFDVDPANLPCGVHAALYFTAMSPDGGLSARNRAGATYGTGYCDAQCPTTLRFVDGKANIEGQIKPGNHTSRAMGACCAELDLWEGNTLAHAYTAHPCVFPGMAVCEGEDCGAKAGVCDHSGCGLGSQSWRLNGDRQTIDTSSKFTVVTQFLTADHSPHGELVEIKQFYLQNGLVVEHQTVPVDSHSSSNSITDSSCVDPKATHGAGSGRQFQNMGGLLSMGRALADGMVLVMSLWTDETTHQLGSIHKIPATKNIDRSSHERLCPQPSTTRPFVQKHFPHTSVEFSNIKIGPINSTYSIPISFRYPNPKIHTTV